MVNCRVLSQCPGELGPVMDQHRTEAYHLLIEVRQCGQQVRPLLTVPEDAGFMVIKPSVRCESGGISGRS